MELRGLRAQDRGEGELIKPYVVSSQRNMGVKGVTSFYFLHKSELSELFSAHVTDQCSKVTELFLYPKVKISILERMQCRTELRATKKSHCN